MRVAFEIIKVYSDVSMLEELKPNAAVKGIIADTVVTVVSVKWHGADALELTYKNAQGKLANELLYRSDESRIEVIARGRPWSFDGDGRLFRLVSEAQRISLAHLFDPVLAVHSSVIDPLPHQITAVYEVMLSRQPLRFLLADDPGAGKTIMAGLLMKELIARGDLQRCLVVCPGSLAEQWQDELYQRFQLPFEILTNDKLEAARTGNWFIENNLVIARLDKLSRNEDVQAKLTVPDCHWDLIVCDEAHKMSASYFGGEVNFTKRYRLGQLLSTITRHFLLMTATPHNGKEEDFQLFMALLDGDRFEGRFRDGVHTVDVSDLMRRVVKESLVKFDGTPLFPERIAYTMPYKLSDGESRLYHEVTQYVSEEFNRAEALQNNKRAGTVGFALTILQRRLASSPEAIYQSLRRRRERLEQRLREVELLKRGADLAASMPLCDPDDLEELDDAPDAEVEQIEEIVLDQATAARTITELQREIQTLQRLEKLAADVRRSGVDTKWRELAHVLTDIFQPPVLPGCAADDSVPYGAGPIPPPKPSRLQKLIIFTEHRDTLNYLVQRITTVLGRQDAVLCMHGGMGREERKKAEESFKHDPRVQVLVATDAAGEGINLQRAHLMVNYDLPWNPNRIEQRFGRIHRIGQTEVCHMWNLVAEETREGHVYRTLLNKLEEARAALGGKVFDVLGRLQFEGKPLRDLLIEAIRYGERPEVSARLTQVVAFAVDKQQLAQLLDEHALVHDVIDNTRVRKIREDMERAEARRLQPHYIESFFLEAFKELGGTCYQREPRRYEITRVPAIIRNRDRLIGVGQPVLPRYERVVFEKELIAPAGQPMAAFLCPGHPLLNATLDLILERNRALLRRGALLVDKLDHSTQPRLLAYLEHAIQDASLTRTGERRVVSKRVLYVEHTPDGTMRHFQYAPYLDYRPLMPDEPRLEEILQCDECRWITGSAAGSAGFQPASSSAPGFDELLASYAITTVVPAHLQEVRARRCELIAKTEAAVKERLTKEIAYWDYRAQQLQIQEQAGKANAKLNSQEARRRADELQARLQKRLADLKLESQISPLPPVVLGAALVVPIGLLNKMRQGAAAGQVQLGQTTSAAPGKQAVAARAREIVMQHERALGNVPIDREAEKAGYDIESRVPGTGRLRFIEVKARDTHADTITVTKNEILYSLNKPDDYILAIVLLDGDNHALHYVRRPFTREPDFGVTSVNYSLTELLDKAERCSQEKCI